jgi:chromate transporter
VVGDRRWPEQEHGDNLALVRRGEGDGVAMARLRRSTWAGSLLDGVDIAAVGLMAAVTLALARVALVDPSPSPSQSGALAVLVRWTSTQPGLITAGAAIGLLHLLA